MAGIAVQRMAAAGSLQCGSVTLIAAGPNGWIIPKGAAEAIARIIGVNDRLQGCGVIKRCRYAAELVKIVDQVVQRRINRIHAIHSRHLP